MSVQDARPRQHMQAGWGIPKQVPLRTNVLAPKQTRMLLLGPGTVSWPDTKLPKPPPPQQEQPCLLTSRQPGSPAVPRNSKELLLRPWCDLCSLNLAPTRALSNPPLPAFRPEMKMRRSMVKPGDTQEPTGVSEGHLHKGSWDQQRLLHTKCFHDGEAPRLLEGADSGKNSFCQPEDPLGPPHSKGEGHRPHLNR